MFTRPAQWTGIYFIAFDTPRAPGDTGAVAIAQLFEEIPAGADGRRAALAVARIGGSGAPPGPASSPRPGLGAAVGPGAAAEGREAIAVPDALAALVPGGVRRGEALALGGSRTVDYLTLALLAEAMRQGLWCAAVGAGALGGAALAGLLGAAAVREGALQRLLVVAEPGERWAEVAAVLADGVDLLVLCPPGAVSAQVARRVDARLRQGVADAARHRAALLVLGPWPSARTVLRVRRLGWSGLDSGTGHLAGGRAEITAEDRARRVRTVRVWLPGADGVVLASAGEVPERSGRDGWGVHDGRGVEAGGGTRRLTAVA